jgi:hypothetical protein
MMKLRTSHLSALIVAVQCVLAGCASVPQTGVQSGAAEVKLYELGKLSMVEYEVVRRIWVDSWRTALRLPTYASEAEGIASLQAEAARVGADGLTNVICIDHSRAKPSEAAPPAIICYGNAIRLRRS